MSVFTHQADDTWTVVLAGEVDVTSGDLVLDAFAQATAGRYSRVVIDARDVSFLDAGGIRALSAAMAAWNRPVWLRSPSPAVRRVAEIVGLGPISWRGDPADGEVRIA